MKKKLVIHLAAIAILGFGISLCSAQDFSMIGYATVNADGINTTTGGAGGKTVVIKTLDELVAWGASREKNTTPEIAQISGKIVASGTNTLITIKNGANITITGVGTTGELSGIGLNIRDYTNVIVQNLKIHEVFYPDDDLTLDNVQHAWVNKCELYSKIGGNVTVDTYDGLLDIKKGSRWITVSWCYLHDHMKCSLVGHSDNAGQQAEDSQIRVTYHHNYFVRTDGRNPSLRFGAVHMFNNYYGDITDYGVAARDGGHAKVENCHYENVKLPMSTDKFPVTGFPNGYICQTGNIFTGTCGANVISQTGCDFWNATSLPYTYKLDDVTTVKATVAKNAGFGNNAATSVEKTYFAQATKSNRTIVMQNSLVNIKLTTGDVYDIRGRKLSSALNMQTKPLHGILIVKQASNSVAK